MNLIQLNYVSTQVAKELNQELLGGLPTENRILILTPKEGTSKASTLYIPEAAKGDMPKKGVVIQRGEITEEYKSYRELTTVGRIVTYGMYAGKELEFDDSPFKESLREVLKNNTVTVLTLNEIIYSELNK